MASPAAVLAILVEANTTAANSALTKTQANLKKTAATASATNKTMASSFASAGSKMKAIGGTLTKAITLPVVAIGGLAIKASIDFDHAMNLIQTTAGASAKEVERMHEAVLNFAASGKTEFAPNELAAALYDIESAGIRGTEAMKVLKKSSELAALGQSDLETTTKALVAAQKTGIKGSENLNKELATLNSIVGSGIMKMDDLVAAMGTGFLGAAEGVGLSLKDVGGALAELTKQGVPANAAATRLRQTFSLIASPTDKAKTALATLGLTSDQLALKMRSKEGLVGALTLLQDRLGQKFDLSTNKGLSQARSLLSEAFGGAKSGTTLIQLLRNLDDLKKVTDNVTPNMEALKKSIEAVNADPAVQLRKTWVLIQTAMTRLGDVLVPIIVPALVKVGFAISDIAKAFDKLSPTVKKVIVYFILAAAVIGPLLSLLGYMVLGIVALGAVSGTVWLVVAGIVALGAALVIAYSKSETFRKAMGTGLKALGDAAKQVWPLLLKGLDALKATFPAVKDAAMALFNFLGRMGGVIWPVLVEGAQAFGKVLPPLKQLALDAFGAIRDIVVDVLAVFKTWAPIIGGVIAFIVKVADKLGIFKVFFDIIQKSFKGFVLGMRGLIEIIHGVIDVIAGILTLDFGKISKGLGEIFGGIGKLLLGAFLQATAPLRAIFAAIFRAIWNVIKGFVGAVWTVLKPIVNILITPYKIWFRFVVAAVKDIISAIGKVVKWIREHWGPIGHVLGTPFRIAGKIIQDVFGPVIKWVGDKIGKIIDFAKKVVGYFQRGWPIVKERLFAPFKAIGGFVKDKFNAVIGFAKKVINWVKDKWGKLKDFLTKPFDAIASTISGIFDKVKGVILDAVNFILKIIGHIPGVPNLQLGSGGNKKGSGAILPKSAVSGRAEHRGTLARQGRLPAHNARGGHIRKPMLTMIGEEAPQHPEYVIPTNPKHRKRAMALWQHAGKQMGVQQAFAGISVGFDGVSVEGIHLGPQAPFDVFKKAADALGVDIPGLSDAVRTAVEEALKALPINFPKWLQPTKDFMIDKATSWVDALPGMATGGVVGAGGKDKELRRLTPGETVLPKDVGLGGEQGKKMLAATTKNAKQMGKVLKEGLAKGYKDSAKETTTFVDKHGKALEGMRKSSAATTQKYSRNTISDFSQTTQKSAAQTEKLKDGTSKDFDQTQQKAGQSTQKLQQHTSNDMQQANQKAQKASSQMQHGVTHNYGAMAKGAGKGISILGQETNKALKALDVKPVNFGAKSVKAQKGGSAKMARGGNVWMQGVSPVGDHIPAMLEKDEYVVNKRAAAKHRPLLDRINFMDAPRFQGGGSTEAVGQFANMKPGIIALAKYMLKTFGGYMSAGYATSGHAANSDHYKGLAADIVPTDWTGASRYANKIGSQLLQGIYNPGSHGGSAVSWSGGSQVPTSYWGGATWAQHLTHLHMATSQMISGVAGAAQKLKDVIITGPDGVLKGMAQAAVSKVQTAAQAYVDKHSGSNTVMGPLQGGRDVTASWYGPLSTQGAHPVGAGGVPMRGDMFAELNMGTALGHLPFGGKLQVGYKGRSVVGEKQDIGAGGAGIGGTVRAIDLWTEMADKFPGLKSAGLAVVQVKAAQEGGLAQLLQGGGSASKMQQGKDNKQGSGKGINVGDLSIRKLQHLTRDKGNKMQDDALKEMLDRIHKAESGTPLKDHGKLHEWDEKLAVLELKHKFHPKSKTHEHQLNQFLRKHGGDLLRGLTHRHDEYQKLMHKKAIAKHTPSQKDDERIQEKIDQFLGKVDPKDSLLQKIQKGRRGKGTGFPTPAIPVPIRAFGHLKKYLDEMDVLVLERELHPRAKAPKRKLHDFLEDEGRYIISTLKRRANIWHDLKIKQKIAKLTPDKKDDERIAKLIEDFLGKKAGAGAGDVDAVSRTQQFFEFLQLLGPVPGFNQQLGGPIQKLATGGRVRSQFQLVGERGPELARLPQGSQVHSASETQMLMQALEAYRGPQQTAGAGGLGNVQVDVYIGGEKINERIDVRINRSKRREAHRQRAGVDPMR